MATKKTQAMRLLDSRGISYRATVYDSSGEFHSAEEAASLIGAPPELVYKTLVTLRESAQTTPIVVMVPATAQLNLKLLAAELGEKRLRMASQREAERLTGMQAGAISALALRKAGLEILIDERAQEQERVYISGGVRGIEIEISVADLASVTGARFVRATG